MVAKFSDIIKNSIGKPKCLPFVITIDSFEFETLVESKTLTIENCDVYGTKLLYFFYGRPAFSKSTGEAKSLAHAPVTLILEPFELPKPVRIMPFDSGAWNLTHYKKYVHGGMELADFEIGDNVVSAAQLVKKFFGNATKYLSGEAVSNANIPPNNHYAQAYFSIITDKSSSDLDDRRATIELQYDINIDLKRQKIMAIVLPHSLLAWEPYADFINTFRATPLPYIWTIANFTEHVGKVKQLTFEFLQKNGYA